VTNTPAGTVAATTVQAAINELDGDVSAHLADTIGAHAASAISNVPAGTVAATTVQAAIDELAGDIAAVGGSSLGAGVANVLDYGAVGDGTTDDYAAIAAAVATGLLVYFPPLVYAISAGIGVSTAGQHVWAYGATLKKTANVDGMTLSGTDCKVYGLTVNGNAHTGAGIIITGDRCNMVNCYAYDNQDGLVVYGPNAVPGADIAVIRGCKTYGNAGSGIYLRNATDATVVDCLSQTNDDHGILMETKCYSVKIIGCLIDDNNVDNTGCHNITVREGDSTIIMGCVITNCENGGHGIRFDSAPANQYGMQVIGNTIAQNGGYGVHVRANSGHVSSQVIVSHNRFTGNTGGTVLIDTGCSECEVSSNTLHAAISDSGTDTRYFANSTGPGGLLTVKEADGSPSGNVHTLSFASGTVSISAGVATYTPASTLSSAFFQQSIDPLQWKLTVGTENTSSSNTDVTKFSNNTANNVEWVISLHLPAGSYKLDMPMGLGAGFGIARALIGGVQVASNDRYSASADTYPVVTLDLGALSAGVNVLALTVTTKNASATGKQLVLRGARLYQYA
jgi:hypothetical protein